ncbi:MAG: MoaD/ThiS family protein [Candidatus Bathyarchaeota archaeon]
MISVTVEFNGTLRTLAKMRKCTVELEEKTMISTLVHKLKTEIFQGEEFVDESNLLIMLNGKEIRVLNGFKTELKGNDVIKLIPASHGG